MAISALPRHDSKPGGYRQRNRRAPKERGEVITAHRQRNVQAENEPQALAPLAHGLSAETAPAATVTITPTTITIQTGTTTATGTTIETTTGITTATTTETVPAETKEGLTAATTTAPTTTAALMEAKTTVLTTADLTTATTVLMTTMASTTEAIPGNRKTTTADLQRQTTATAEAHRVREVDPA